MNKSTFRPKKSLGQNFLVDENIARKIIAAIAPDSQDAVVEIGPGFGVLTKYLLPEVESLVGIEIDCELAGDLKSRFSGSANFEAVCGDFLEFDLSGFARKKKQVRVLGNIPYHITSPVIFKVFETREYVKDMFLMIQKEVAQRIVAAPGSKAYGILSVFSQLYSHPKILFTVSRHVFKPKPDVLSAVVRWDFTEPPAVTIKNPALLNRIIHACFQQRRKMLRRSLQQLSELPTNPDPCSINLERRPEELSYNEFVQLSNELSE